jgi:hypothetical protein
VTIKDLFSKPTKQLDEAILNWVVKRDQSFLEVESEEFKEMFQRVVLPSADTIKRRIMDTFEKKRTEICIIMQNNSSKVSFTTDCWTSPNNIAFMGVTVHYIDENWLMQAKTLDFFALPGIFSVIFNS